MNYEEKWLPENLVSTKFFIISILLFPITLLLVASFQPGFFFDRTSIWYLLSANVFFLHFLMFCLLTLLLICKIGGLKLSDVGLKRSQIFAVSWTPITVWIAAQLVLSALIPFGLAKPEINSLWLVQGDVIKAISLFFANMIGTGLNEETFFRGYVFTQLYAKFAGRSDDEKLNFKPLIGSMLLSAIIFAVMHLQINPLSLLMFLIGGTISCLIYVRTRNLFISIGFHAVFNSPMPLLQTDADTAKIVVIFLMVVLIIIYPFLNTPNMRLRKIQ